ncbi:MAG TPA: TauD/TfdA family dioxygenase [Pyrinomonadaceae bacterium]|jgi:alpha-ketoglutarate-dependent taurine dioxygenase|nr:TauD/TfdA family dioxygenase [Pyrinomonadaceae bacterium]
MKPIRAQRRSINIASPSLVTARPFYVDKDLPLLVVPAVAGVDLVTWAEHNHALIDEYLDKHGAILFRDFHVATTANFEQFIRASAGELLEYADQTSPRHKVSGNVYTSTDYPARQSIFLHNESSYAAVWPLRIFFFCVSPPDTGGETPIADVRKVLSRIPAYIKQRFLEKGWMLARNFGGGLGLPWQTVFQTSDRKAVEDYCREAEITFEWKGEGQLTTRQIRRAIVNHPRTGEPVWFNHATFFHSSTVQREIRQMLLTQYSERQLPYQTYYGDGSELEDSTLELLRAAYRKETVSFRWQQGDILMLDNMLVAHGRNPFTGPRKIVAGMAQPFKYTDVQQP